MKLTASGIILFLTMSLILAGVGLAEVKEKKTYTATVDKDGAQRVNILAGSYFFDPNYIIVKINAPVELMVKKEAGKPHSLVINAPEAGIDVNESLSTEPKVIRFTPTRIGKYSFYCDKKFLFFKSHRDSGMEGTLEVVE